MQKQNFIQFVKTCSRIILNNWVNSGTKKVKIVEVGPRDGLQNEKTIISTENKIALIKKLIDSGLKTIETTSFVSPKWVPQMADHSEIAQKSTTFDKSCRFPVLVPNIQGLHKAIDSGVKDIAIFAAASEKFSKKNINCSIEESLHRYKEVCLEARKRSVKIRGYVSCVVGCPYEGKVDPGKVFEVASILLYNGCEEVSLGDTIGVGTPKDVELLLRRILPNIQSTKIAMHFHDTYGQALANVLMSLRMGVRTFDSSVSGLGGCPYAKGASGNLATEDLVYMLHGMGMETGVDFEKLLQTSDWISQTLGRPPSSKVALAKSGSMKNDS